MKKKFAIVFLSLFLVVSLPFAAHANIVTATGKYIINAVKHAPGGAKVHATNTATGAKHVIKHGVSSADLGKGIGAGIVGFGVATGAGLAFQAITGLALDAVDWVMDKENNRVKYKDSSMVAPPDGKEYRVIGSVGTWSSTKKAACIAAVPALKSVTGQNVTFQEIYSNGDCRYTFDNGGNLYQSLESKPYVADPTKPEWKYISFNDLAQKDIELADGGEVLSQKDIEDYVTHLAKEGKLDTELDNAPDITQPENPDITQPENPEEPNPEEPQECPSGSVKVDDVCVKIPDSDSDEPLFCDSSEFTKKVCDWIDWTQTEHDELEPDAGKVDVIDKSKDLNIDKNRIDFTDQCPAPTPINTSVGGFPVSTELNYQPLCDFFTMLNPFVIGMGGISSALIIAGGARRG